MGACVSKNEKDVKQPNDKAKAKVAGGEQKDDNAPQMEKADDKAIPEKKDDVKEAEKKAD